MLKQNLTEFTALLITVVSCIGDICGVFETAAFNTSEPAEMTLSRSLLISILLVFHSNFVCLVLFLKCSEIMVENCNLSPGVFVVTDECDSARISST